MAGGNMAKKKPKRVNPGQHDQHVFTWYRHLLITDTRPLSSAFISIIIGGSNG